MSRTYKRLQMFTQVFTQPTMADDELSVRVGTGEGERYTCTAFGFPAVPFRRPCLHSFFSYGPDSGFFRA